MTLFSPFLLLLLSLLLSSISFAIHFTSAQTVAIIGDYGRAVPQAGYTSTGEAAVAQNLIQRWNDSLPVSGLDAIITTGDNNYNGYQDTIDANIGQYYCKYITPYHGNYTWCQQFHQQNPNIKNKFFPSLGNVDAGVHNGYGQPYLDYFKNSLPPNDTSAPASAGGRYYDHIVRNKNGLPMIHFFALNSNEWEPDGVDQNSKQAQWLKNTLATSECPFRVVYFHYCPYSFDDRNGASPFMRWPFQKWGVSTVISGHAHVYQKIVMNEESYSSSSSSSTSSTSTAAKSPFIYLGMGLSGTPNIYGFNVTQSDINSGNPSFSNQFTGLASFYNKTYGAQKLVVSDDGLHMTITFYSVDFTFVDSVTFPRIDSKNSQTASPGGSSNNNHNKNPHHSTSGKIDGILFGIVGTTVVCFFILTISYCVKRSKEDRMDRVHPLRSRSARRAQAWGERAHNREVHHENFVQGSMVVEPMSEHQQGLLDN